MSRESLAEERKDKELRIAPGQAQLSDDEEITMRDMIRGMVAEARTRQLHLRVFDVRYATAGIPKVYKEYIYFPGGSFEILETGNLQKAATSAQKLDYPKLIPMSAILIVELCEPNK